MIFRRLASSRLYRQHTSWNYHRVRPFSSKNYIRLAENLPWRNISTISSSADVRGNGIAKAKSLGGIIGPFLSVQSSRDSPKPESRTESDVWVVGADVSEHELGRSKL